MTRDHDYLAGPALRSQIGADGPGLAAGGCLGGRMGLLTTVLIGGAFAWIALRPRQFVVAAGGFEVAESQLERLKLVRVRRGADGTTRPLRPSS